MSIIKSKERSTNSTRFTLEWVLE